MNDAQPRALSAAQINSFIADGFVRIDDAFSAETAAAARAILWRCMGLSPDAPSDWSEPVIRLGHFSDPPFVAAANTPVLHAAYDALVGSGRWLAPKAIGTFPVRFPGNREPGDDGWHVDASFGTDNPDFLNWRVNVVSRGRALLMLLLFSDIGPDDAPTRIRVGSHRLIARRLLPHGNDGLSLRELAEDGFAGSESCEQLSATGGVGTVYLCHPFLVHAAQRHRGAAPRFLAQPPLLPAVAFDPTLPPSPVQIAIRDACGLTF